MKLINSIRYHTTLVKGVMRLLIRLFRSSVALTPSRSRVNMKLGSGIGVMSLASDFSNSPHE